MLTRCPGCATTFRVTPEQLKARQGRVRCGECETVFSALDTLIEETVVLAAEEPAVAVETPAIAVPAADLAPPEPEPEPAASLPPAPIAAEPAAAWVIPTDAIDAATSESTAALPEETRPADFEPLLHEAPRRRAWPWLIATLAATIVLAAQAVLHYRTEIAVLYPWAKPLLTATCNTFGCRLWLPRKPELLAIETSDLAPKGDAGLMLTATLKNRAPFAQEYPHLELTLTDTADQALTRRVLAPGDYLAPATATATGFAAGGELAIRLNVDAATIAAGYRLYVFYP